MFSPISPSATYSPLKNLRASRSTTQDTGNLSMTMSADSPYQPRVKDIGKKLSNLQISQNHAPQTKSDEIEAKIRHIDERITHNHAYTEDKLNVFTETVNKIEENVAAEIIARELLQERSVKELTLVESNLALDLKNEREQNKESERRLLGKVEGKIHAVKIEFAQEQTRIHQYKEEQLQVVSDQVSDLQHGIKEEIAVREEVQNNIIKSISSRINKVQEALDMERKVRNETEAFLYRKIEEISLGLEGQVQAEKERRERAEAQMLRLLEEACSKFEDQVGSARRY